MKTITYNAQYCPKRNPARAAHVAAFARLAALHPVAIGVNEAGGYRTELKHVPGYRIIQPLGYRGKNALLIRDDVKVHAHGTFKLHGRRFVGRDVPGARKTGWTEARAILWALITDPDTGLLTYVETWHTVPGQSHSERARKLLAEEVSKAAAWVARQEHSVDLMGDTNGRPSLHIFDPLRKAGAVPAFAVSRDGAPIDGHWITDGAGEAEALDGYPSDHKPVVCDITWVKHRPRKPAPKPKEAPVSARIDAVDLSHWQGDALDFHAAKRAGVKGVWHKATEGTGYVDPMHDRRQRETAAADVPFGSYHFAKPGDATAQAHHFLRHAAAGRGDLRPMLDLEDATMGGWSVATRTAWVKEWVRIVAAAAGVPPVIYTRFDLAEHFDCPLWVARYSDAMSAPHVPRPWKAWSIWQFSNGAFGRPDSVAGIGHCDLNTFNSGVDIDLFIIGNQSEEDDMQLTDKIWPRRKDSKTVGDVIRSLDRFIDRQDARAKATLAAISGIPAAVEAQLPEGQAGGFTIDDVRKAAEAAVASVLKEGVGQ